MCRYSRGGNVHFDKVFRGLNINIRMNIQYNNSFEMYVVLSANFQGERVFEVVVFSFLIYRQICKICRLDMPWKYN